MDGVSTDAGIIGVKADDPNLRVVNIATLPEFLHQVQLARQWFQAGYYPVDLPGDQVTANWHAGQYAMEIDVVHRDSLGQLKQTYGYDFVAKGLGPLILTSRRAKHALFCSPGLMVSGLFPLPDAHTSLVAYG